MTTTIQTSSEGIYQASQGITAMGTSNYVSQSRKGCLLFAGNGGVYHSWYSGALNAINTPIALTRKGIPNASISVDSTFGNATFRTRATNAVTYMQGATSPFRWATGKVHLIGSSMGSVCALNWAKNNPTLVQSIALTIGPPDVQAMHSENRGGLAATIAAAYGGGAPPNAENPIDYAADLSGIPIKIWYSNNDTLCPSSEVLGFATPANAQVVDMGALGHAVNGSEVQGIYEWILANNS